MKESNIRAKAAKRFRRAYESKHREGIQANLLNRQFTVSKPNTVWVSDITMIPTKMGWLHLATVMDLYSRGIVGHAMSNTTTTTLIKDALKMALNQRKRTGALLLHSDQGSQYRSSEYQTMLKENNIIASMSRKGECHDNAVMESFYHTLKTELVYHERYDSYKEAKASLFDYIEIFYNRQRSHSTLGYRAPFEYERVNQC